MGNSIRARRVAAQWAAEKAAKRAAETEAAERAVAEFERDFLDRERAAAACGWSVHRFKREQTAGRGPVPTKMGGNKQSRVFWHRLEVAAYVADPAGYNARRSATS